jgi:hypothetical protein
MMYEIVDQFGRQSHGGIVEKDFCPGHQRSSL